MALIRPSVCRALRAVVLAVFLLIPVSVAMATDDDPVVARVNGVDIHQSALAFAAEGLGPNLQRMSPDQKRAYLIDYCVNVIVLSQAAEQQKIQDRPDVKQWMAFDHNRRLMATLLQDTVRAALTDQAEHDFYKEAIKHMANVEEVRARHILVATEDEAKAILAKLKGGADFATLAKEKSKDPSAAKNGGDLGYFTKEVMVPEFAYVAFKLDKGQISDPVKTQFGWHIIQVEDKRMRPAPTFAEMKPKMDAYIKGFAQQELINSLRKTATVELLDKPVAGPSSNPAAAPSH